MISVGEARAKLLDLVSPKLEETVPLWDAAGRVLAQRLVLFHLSLRWGSRDPYVFRKFTFLTSLSSLV